MEGDGLVAMLDDKDARREAAIELCRRGDAASVGPVFGALRRMTRGEAVRVLPHVVHFGERAVPHLIDGLRSKKAFVRHGCALALGVVKSAEGIEPLCDLLLAEPTEVWKEVARAVGELGGGAVLPLAARLRESAPDQRERVAWALAHVAGKGGRGAVESLAAGRDATAAGVARRALDRADEARSSDAEVRSASGGGETTVNRAFSRRFFEALAAGRPLAGADLSGEVQLLDDADLLEDGEGDGEELLDDDLIPG
jgi:HEAT repeat protein